MPTPRLLRPSAAIAAAILAIATVTAVVLASAPARASARVSAARAYVVVIDAGHQAKADLRLEPVGPGSTTMKPRVEGGTSGVATHRPESLDNLQVALRLRDALVARGVKVIMVRTTQTVDIANSRRAQISNAAHADLFIRLHCDGSTNHATTGILTLVPARNRWTLPILAASTRAGRDLRAAVLSATGAHDRGIQPRGDLTGFNWSQVPVALVEMGMMSNTREDRALASAAYQTRLAAGMANGVMRFLSGR